MNKSLQKVLSCAVAFIMLITSVLSGTVITFAESNDQIMANTDISNDDDKRGNFDGDEAITANDAAVLLGYVLDKATKNVNEHLKKLSEEMITWLGDVDGDGMISAKDVSQILKKSIGDFNFTGPLKPKPGETSTETETSTITGTETETSTTTVTEAPIDTTTEAIVEGPAQNAVYKGYNVVVDARATSDPDRAEQPIFKTVREAIEAAGDGGSEESPFVIGIVPGVYREQIIVNKPWITFKKITNSTSKAEDATLTWYYLEGYTYDNVGENGLWDPNNPEINKNGENGIKSWGRSTWIQGGATGFRAEGIYFENSANLYMTQEELDANVRAVTTKNSAGQDSWKGDRTGLTVRNGIPTGLIGDKITIDYWADKNHYPSASVPDDVRAEAWRERACALYTEADKATYINCKVVSSQDTIGTGKRAYFKNCYLAGHVDFICGGGQMLFDECNIHWQSSPYEETGGYLTAAQTGAYPERGYLFYNCKVTGEDKTTNVTFGRPWSGVNAETIWVNTKSDESKVVGKGNLISPAGWHDMGSKPEEARFFEYNTMNSAGESILTDEVKAKRRGRTIEEKGIIKGILDEWNVIKYNPYEYTAAYLDRSDLSDLKIAYDNWDPSNSKATYDTIKADAEQLTLEENYSENFVLPDAPEGYEVKYEILEGSNFVKIGDDGKTVTVLTRPLYLRPNADITFLAYFKKTGTIVGIEKEIHTQILAETDSAGTFDASGKIKFIIPPKDTVNVTLAFTATNGTVIDTAELAIPAASKSFDYEIKGLPASEYNIVVNVSDSKYSVKGGNIKNFTGEANVPKTLDDIEIGILEDQTAAASGGPTAIDDSKIPSGVTMERVDDPKGEKQGKVNHYRNTTDKSDLSYGWYWDLMDIVSNTTGQSADDLKIADYVTLEFDILVPDGSDWGNPVSAIDILGNGDTTALKYENKADDTRFARFYFGKWNQLNIVTSKGNKESIAKPEGETACILNAVGKFKDGEKTNGKNVWRNIKAGIDFKNNVINFEYEGGDTSVNKFTVFPSNIDRSKLIMAFYPAEQKSNNDEYYFTDVKVSYERIMAGEDLTGAINISGTSQNITNITLVNSKQEAYTHIAEIAEDGAISFENDPVPAGKYRVDYVCKNGYIIKSIKVGETVINPDENGNYFIDVAEGMGNLEIIAEGVAGFENAEKAIIATMDKYATKGADNVYALKEALPAIEEAGYSIVIKSCSYVNTDGSLIESTDKTAAAAPLIFTITNISNNETEEYPVQVTPKLKDDIFYYSSFEEKAVNSKVENNGYSADIVKNADIAADRGNVFKFKYTSPKDYNDKVNACEFDNMLQGKTYAISLDVLKTDISSNGWRINLGKQACALWNGKTISFNYEGIGGSNYTSDAIYGTTSNIISETSANTWYNLTFICNTASGNVDVYVGDTYVTSCKGAENVLPSYIQFATHYNPVAEIYLDNVKVYEYPDEASIIADIENTLTEANITIPTSMSDSDTEQTINVPTVTKNGAAINWTSSNQDFIAIADGTDNQKTVTIKVPAANAKHSLKATVEADVPYLPIYNNITKVSAIKNYEINFTATNVAKHNFSITSTAANSGAKVTIVDGENNKVADAEAITANYSKELNAGQYKVKFSFDDENSYVSEVKNGDTTVTADTDGNYELDLSSDDVTFTITTATVDFTAAENAIKGALDKAKAADSTGATYKLDKALNLEAPEGFTIAINDNDAIKASGALNKKESGSASTVKVTFTITDTASNKTKTAEYSVEQPVQNSDYVFYYDFEDYDKDSSLGTVIEGSGTDRGIIDYSEERGHFFKYTETGSDKMTSIVKFDNLEQGKTYEISFDVMRIADTVTGGYIPENSDSVSSTKAKTYGWNIALTSEITQCKQFRYCGGTVKTIQNGALVDTILGKEYTDNNADNTDCWKSNQWYTIKFIINTNTENPTITLDGKDTPLNVDYAMPNMLCVRSEYGSRIPNDKICFDNITVKEVESTVTQSDDDINTAAMTDDETSVNLDAEDSLSDEAVSAPEEEAATNENSDVTENTVESIVEDIVESIIGSTENADVSDDSNSAENADISDDSNSDSDIAPEDTQSDVASDETEESNADDSSLAEI